MRMWVTARNDLSVIHDTFRRKKDVKAVSSTFRYRYRCLSVTMRPADYLMSPHLAHGPIWVWDPCSKDSYYSLVSDNNYSQKISSWCWHPGSDDVIQICINLLPNVIAKNTKIQNFSIFFNPNYKTFCTLKGLISSVAQSAGWSYGLQPTWLRLPFARLDFCQNLGFWAIILDPEMLETNQGH